MKPTPRRLTIDGVRAFAQTYRMLRKHLREPRRSAARIAWHHGPVRPTRKEQADGR